MLCLFEACHFKTVYGAHMVASDVDRHLIEVQLSSTRVFDGALMKVNRDVVRLPNGEERRWLQDGDEFTIRARANAAGRVSIGFGACTGRVLPAVPYPLPRG